MIDNMLHQSDKSVNKVVPSAGGTVQTTLQKFAIDVR
jgi:hypothetical protein